MEGSIEHFKKLRALEGMENSITSYLSFSLVLSFQYHDLFFDGEFQMRSQI